MEETVVESVSGAALTPGIGLQQVAPQEWRIVFGPVARRGADAHEEAVLRLELPPGVDEAADVDVEMEGGALVVRLRGLAVEHADAGTGEVVEQPGAAGGEQAAPVPVELLTQLAAVVEEQQDILRRIEAATALSQRERVTLTTATGELEYTLPFASDETYGSGAVSAILSPSGKPHRSIAQDRRRAHELLGVKIGNQYRYPKFQIDLAHQQIRPVVAYANRLLECDADPWGTLDWWYSEDEGLNDRRPVDMLESGELTEELVDLAIQLGQQGME
ncbi:hypothetical protein A5715_18955 [Mycolicibacter heraklionensis]|nr:hypothetical protein A5715_18955 [Mycolicibacter heraklionensis]